MFFLNADQRSSKLRFLFLHVFCRCILSERHQRFSSLSDSCGFFSFLEHLNSIIVSISCIYPHLWHRLHSDDGVHSFFVIFNPGCQNIEYYLLFLLVFLKIKLLLLIYCDIWCPFNLSSPPVWKIAFSSNIISLMKLSFFSIILLATLKAFLQSLFW